MKGWNNSNSNQPESQQQRTEMFQQFEEQKTKKRKKLKLYLFSAVAIIVLVSGWWAYTYFLTPGSYDVFAKCLTEKGAVMYGAIEWCKYTQGQANMFGKSFKYINYHDESELSGIKTRPTWVIDGEWYEKVQSFEKLAVVTGCSIS